MLTILPVDNLLAIPPPTSSTIFTQTPFPFYLPLAARQEVAQSLCVEALAADTLVLLGQPGVLQALLYSVASPVTYSK